jgi:hypothetical protein
LILPKLNGGDDNMKKVLMIAVTALALLLFFTISGSAKDKTMTWTGWISDSHCGVKGMSADHADCAKKCIQGMGAKYVFVETASKKITPIQNQDAVKDTDPGHEVKATGHLMQDKSLHVDKIEAAM